MPDRYMGRSVVGRLKFQEVVAGLKDLQTEVAIYWKVGEPDEFRILGSNLGRNYYQAGAEDYNYVGSIDIVGVNETTGNFVVVDVKTGLQEIEAVYSQQLQLLGYMLAHVLKVPRIETRITKVYDTGAVKTSSHVIEKEEMELHGKIFRSYHANIKENYREYTKGHETTFYTTDATCKWCPCKTVCPAYEQWQSTLEAEGRIKLTESFFPTQTESISPTQSTTNSLPESQP